MEGSYVVKIEYPLRAAARVAAYNVLMCLFLAAIAVTLGMLFGPGAMLLVLFAVAIASPLGRLWWP